MARNIISVSITGAQTQFLIENPDISPSKILQDQLNGLMETKLNPTFLKEMTEELKRKEEAIERWREMFYKAQDFLTKEGLNDKFNNLL